MRVVAPGAEIYTEVVASDGHILPAGELLRYVGQVCLRIHFFENQKSGFAVWPFESIV